MEIVEMINTLAQRAGVTEEEGKLLAEALKTDALKGIKLPDPVAGRLQGSLMNLDAALNNAEIKKKFTAEALNGVDASLNNLWKQHGFNEDIIAEIKKEDKTSARLAKSFELLKAQAVKATNPQQKSELEAKLIAAQNELAESVKRHDSLEAKYKGEFERLSSEKANLIRDYTITQNLMRHTQKIKSEIPESLRLDNLKLALDKAAAEGGFTLITNGNNIEVRQANDINLKYHINHTPVTFDILVDKVMTDYGLIAKSEPNTPQLNGNHWLPQHNTANINPAYSSYAEKAQIAIQNNTRR